MLCELVINELEMQKEAFIALYEVLSSTRGTDKNQNPRQK
jgi:hypothetical protein